MKGKWKQTSAWMAVLIGMFVVLLSFTGMVIFGARAQRPGYGVVAVMLEGTMTGALFYLWRQQVTLRRREVLEISKMLESRNEYIHEQLQLISLRYGSDPPIRGSVRQIAQSLEVKLPRETDGAAQVVCWAVCSFEEQFQSRSTSMSFSSKTGDTMSPMIAMVSVIDPIQLFAPPPVTAAHSRRQACQSA